MQTKYMKNFMSEKKIEDYITTHKVRRASSIRIIEQRLKWILAKKRPDETVILVDAERTWNSIKKLNNKYAFVCYQQEKTNKLPNGNYVMWKYYLGDAMLAELKGDGNKLEKIKERIKSDINSLNIKLFISANMVTTLDFLVLEAMSELNIPVVFVEHGLMANVVLEKRYQVAWNYRKQYINYYWFWSERNRDAFIDYNISREDNSYICGYPRNISKKIYTNEWSVLFVGEAISGESNVVERYYSALKMVYEICNKLGISFRYKRHPKENRMRVKMCLGNDESMYENDLFKAFERNKIVIGGRTSAVLEAAMNGNYAIQINYDNDRCGRVLFKSVYVINSIGDELAALLTSIINGDLKLKEIDSYDVTTVSDIVGTYNQLIRISLSETNY